MQQDHAEAARWYRKAADQGHTQAQYNLGFMFANGNGVQQDVAEALQWMRKAAAQGLAETKQKIKLIEDHLKASAAAAPAASSPRTCAHCGVAETVGGSVALKPCSRCKAVVHCGKECQAAHWKGGGAQGGAQGVQE